MKRAWLIALVALVSFAASVCAEDWRAAKWWRTLPAAGREFYMRGAFDGIMLGPSFVTSDADAAKVRTGLLNLFKGMDTTGAIKAVDWFYQTPENRKIPIAAAVLYVAMAGHPEMRADAAKMLIELRRKS